MIDLPFDIGFILIGLCALSAIGGLACAIIGGILRFNLAYYINDYLSEFDTEGINKVASDVVPVDSSFDTVDLGSGPETMGSIALALGVFVIIYSVVGIMAGLTKQSISLFVLIGCILLSKILEFILLWMMATSSNSFHDNAKDNLIEKMESEYILGEDANDFSIILNSIMMAGQCCGIRESGDFDFNLTYTAKDHTIMLFKLPPSCCNAEAWTKIMDNQNFMHTCMRTESRVNHDGCYDVLFDAASDGTMGTCLIFIILLLLWQCIIVATAVIMVLQPKAEEKAAKVQAEMEAAAVIEAEMKVFTPFSKLSSFQASEINRIKSTEIW